MLLNDVLVVYYIVLDWTLEIVSHFPVRIEGSFTTGVSTYLSTLF